MDALSGSVRGCLAGLIRTCLRATKAHRAELEGILVAFDSVLGRLVAISVGLQGKSGSDLLVCSR